MSVCPSVIIRCFVQTDKDTIVRLSASGRTVILVSGEVTFIRIFVGYHTREGVKVKYLLSVAKIGPIISHIWETVQDMRYFSIIQ